MSLLRRAEHLLIREEEDREGGAASPGKGVLMRNHIKTGTETAVSARTTESPPLELYPEF